MIQPIRRPKKSLIHRLFSSFLILIITLNFIIPVNLSYAQVMPLLNLPLPGSMVGLTPGYNPVLIKGITLYPDNPLEFDFLINSGNSDLKSDALKDEANKLIKYFLASLTVPEQDLWVNLSPYEKDRIVAPGLGITEMGRDLLTQDYVLKQLTASLMYPEDNLGKEFWKRVYKKAQEKFGTTDIPMNTFNKIWIVPNKAVVYEKDNNVFVIESSLKVMLEEDYLALQKNLGNKEIAMDQIQDEKAQEINKVSSDVVREVLLPEIEKEVNEGKNFANLRQIHNSLILATWYKMNLRQSLLGQVYADKNKVKGVDVEDKGIKEKIYQQYLEAFKKGAYDYIKEDYDAATKQIIPRQYFSGGADLRDESKKIDEIEYAKGETPTVAQAATFQKRNAGGEDLRVHEVTVEANGENPAVVAQAQARVAAEKVASETGDAAAIGDKFIKKGISYSLSALAAFPRVDQIEGQGPGFYRPKNTWTDGKPGGIRVRFDTDPRVYGYFNSYSFLIQSAKLPNVFSISTRNIVTAGWTRLSKPRSERYVELSRRALDSFHYNPATGDFYVLFNDDRGLAGYKGSHKLKDVGTLHIWKVSKFTPKIAANSIPIMKNKTEVVVGDPGVMEPEEEEILSQLRNLGDILEPQGYRKDFATGTASLYREIPHKDGSVFDVDHIFSSYSKGSMQRVFQHGGSIIYTDDIYTTYADVTSSTTVTLSSGRFSIEITKARPIEKNPETYSKSAAYDVRRLAVNPQGQVFGISNEAAPVIQKWLEEALSQGFDVSRMPILIISESDAEKIQNLQYADPAALGDKFKSYKARVTDAIEKLQQRTKLTETDVQGGREKYDPTTLKPNDFQGVTTGFWFKEQGFSYSWFRDLQRNIKAAIKKAGLGEKIAFVDEESLHLTTFDLVYSPKITDPNERGQFDAKVKNASDAAKQALENSNQTGPIRMRIEGLGAFAPFVLLIMVSFKSSEDLEEMDKVRQKLEEKTGTPSPFPFTGHVTLGYIVNPMNEEEYRMYKEIIQSEFAKFIHKDGVLNFQVNEIELRNFVNMDDYGAQPIETFYLKNDMVALDLEKIKQKNKEREEDKYGLTLIMGGPFDEAFKRALGEEQVALRQIFEKYGLGDTLLFYDLDDIHATLIGLEGVQKSKQKDGLSPEDLEINLNLEEYEKKSRGIGMSKSMNFNYLLQWVESQNHFEAEIGQGVLEPEREEVTPFFRVTPDGLIVMKGRAQDRNLLSRIRGNFEDNAYIRHKYGKEDDEFFLVLGYLKADSRLLDEAFRRNLARYLEQRREELRFVTTIDSVKVVYYSKTTLQKDARKKELELKFKEKSEIGDLRHYMLSHDPAALGILNEVVRIVPQERLLPLEERGLSASSYPDLFLGLADFYQRQARTGRPDKDGQWQSFFKIIEDGRTVDFYLRRGQFGEFHGVSIPADRLSLADWIFIHSIARAGRPAAGQGRADPNSSNMTVITPENVREKNLDQLWLAWDKAPSGHKWLLLFNPFAIWPPMDNARIIDQPFHVMAARGDDRVYQQDIHKYDNVNDMVELFFELNSSPSLQGQRLFRMGANGWYYSDKPDAPKAGATQSQAHDHLVRFLFPIERVKLSPRKYQIGSVVVSHIDDGEETGIVLEAPAAARKELSKLIVEALGDITAKGNSFNYILAPGGNEDIKTIRVFIMDRPVGIPQPFFPNEWGFAEAGRAGVVDDSRIFYQMTDEQREKYASLLGRQAEVIAWVREQKRSGGFTEINPRLVGNAGQALKMVTAPQKEIDAIIEHLVKSNGGAAQKIELVQGERTDTDAAAVGEAQALIPRLEKFLGGEVGYRPFEYSGTRRLSRDGSIDEMVDGHREARETTEIIYTDQEELIFYRSRHRTGDYTAPLVSLNFSPTEISLEIFDKFSDEEGFGSKKRSVHLINPFFEDVARDTEPKLPPIVVVSEQAAAQWAQWTKEFEKFGIDLNAVAPVRVMTRTQAQKIKGIQFANVDPAAIGNVEQVDQKIKAKPVGGINLDPKLLDLQIKRDGNGVPLPLPMQPIGDMKIEGFFPVIINITPVSLPLLLGLNTQKIPTDDSDVEQGKNKYYRDETEVSSLN